MQSYLIPFRLCGLVQEDHTQQHIAKVCQALEVLSVEMTCLCRISSKQTTVHPIWVSIHLNRVTINLTLNLENHLYRRKQSTQTMVLVLNLDSLKNYLHRPILQFLLLICSLACHKPPLLLWPFLPGVQWQMFTFHCNKETQGK